jgi:hypothetical protein
MIERQITLGTKIVLDPVNATVDLASPFFAINWFNTRAMWLYSLYNIIAARSVFHVGAGVFFKGRTTATLVGSPDFARQVLLIVNYPSGERFLDLLSGRFFQITSLLRMAAVRDFSFVLNTRADGPGLMQQRRHQFDASQAWAVHNYSSSCDIDEEVAFLKNVTAQSGIDLHFASQRGAVVNTEDSEGHRAAMPSITDRIIILKAGNLNQLTTAIRGPYADFTETVQNSYIGTLARTM